jgi:hypothetical protein
MALMTMVALMSSGCGGRSTSGNPVDQPVTAGVATSSTTVPTTSSVAPDPTEAPSTLPLPVTPPAPGPAEAVDARAYLAPLGIDDRPTPGTRYDRSDWPHWADTDGDGCDARQQALIAASITPPQVDPFRCTVLAGDWFSDYDGVTTSDPGDFDVDHLVALANAHASGGWRWTTPQRRSFANDQRNLWPVSASSNRSKGSDTPDAWRPVRREAWCDFAVRWVLVKVAYALTATTSERDALGVMLDTCATLPPPPTRLP